MAEETKLFLSSGNDATASIRKGPLSVLLYGDTGVGKSYQIGRLAHRIFQETGKITRYISYDGGGGVDTMQSFLDTGCMRVFDAIEALQLVHDGKRLSPQTLLRALYKGYWGPAKQVGAGTPASPFKVSMHKLTQEELDNTGMWVIESLGNVATSIQKFYMDTQQKVAQDVVSAYSESGIGDAGEAVPKEQYSKIGMAHYGAIQDFIILDLIPGMQALPAEIVLMSTHESKGADDLGTGEKVYGPLVLGKAATKNLMKSVSVMCHMDKFAVGPVAAAPGVPARPGTTEYRLYYADHPDPQNNQIQWKSQPRVDPALMPELERSYPGGYVKLVPAGMGATFNPGVGLDNFLLERNRLQRMLAQRLMGQK